jgi:tRNA-dihydrouridine synthase A
LDGVMMGRAAYQNPSILLGVDHELFGASVRAFDPTAIMSRIAPYIERELARGERLSSITRHMLGLVQGVPGARGFRRHLTEGAIRPGAGLEVVFEALDFLRVGRLDAVPLAASA